jgi:pyruvate kinase
MDKQTKIIATISDRRCDPEFLTELWKAGMNAVRINTAHQGPADTLKVIENVRKVSDTISVIIDTKGPEVRTRGIEDALVVSTGEKVFIGKAVDGMQGFQTSYESFVKDVPVGSSVLIDDGSVAISVDEVKGESIIGTVQNNGEIGKNKSINVPGVHLHLESLTQKDREYIDFAIEQDIDFIAHSFVRNKQDVAEIQKILDAADSKIKIISKIENQEGVNNIDEIIDVSGGIMVARGDLGIEIPAEEVPAIQKTIIKKCIHKNCPVITATQLLHTMIDNPRPTRAEVSDVANAVYDGTDVLMLSGETAYGKYPLESVKTLAKIASTIEFKTPRMRDKPITSERNRLRNYLVKSAMKATLELEIKALVSDTETGHSARTISSYRGDVPIFAMSPNKRVVRELSISYGIRPFYQEIQKSTDKLVVAMLQTLVDNNAIDEKDLVCVIAGTPGHSKGSNFIEINSAELVLSGRKDHQN